MYTYELKQALVERLMMVPEVSQINYLQYWGEHILFVVLDPMTDAAEQMVTSALERSLQDFQGERTPRVRPRFFATGAPLPSSATLYRRPTPISTESSIPPA